MSFTPAIPLTGYAGWALLKRTMPVQTAALAASAEIKSDEAYFRANIGKVTTADDLMKDRRLLKVTLGAFGLENDINSKFFINKVLSESTLDTKSLVNKLADKSYLKMAQAFGFGDFATPSTKISTFADGILKAYKARTFEAAVGEQDADLRLALNAERELGDLAGKDSSDNTKWYSILGNTALRKVFEKALGLPASVGALDLTQQLDAFKQKAETQFGSNTVSQFKDPDQVQSLIKCFLLRSQASAYAETNQGGAAVSLMAQIISNGRAIRR
jgi:hypothetical protein